MNQPTLLDDQKLELQDLSVKNSTSPLASKNQLMVRQSTLRPQSMVSGGSDPEIIRGVTVGSKNTIVGSQGNRGVSRNSGVNALITAGRDPGRALATLAKDKSEGHVSNNDSKVLNEQKRKLVCKIVTYNLIEPILLILALIDSVCYPNIATVAYFTCVIFLSLMMLSKDTTQIRMKQVISISLIVFTFGVVIAKIVYTVNYYKDHEIHLTEDNVLWYKTFGIWIDTQNLKTRTVSIFISFFFDSMMFIFSILLLALYTNHKKDALLIYRADVKTQYVLHPNFEKHHWTFCVISFAFLLIDCVFLQSVFQIFILILILILMLVWATDKNESSTIRHIIAIYSQAILCFQLLVTFSFQTPFMTQLIRDSKFAIACDMFGLLLYNIKLYQSIIHLISMCACIEMIELYKITRNSIFKGIPNNAGEDIVDRGEIEIAMRTLPKRKQGLDRGRTIAGVGLKDTRKNTASTKFREKTMGLKHLKQADESSIQMVATQYYKDFSPQIWLWACRFTCFIWCYAYHDFQSWVILFWIMHSTVFKSTKFFVNMTMRVYMPLFILIFLFYYMINIPGVVEFEVMSDNMSTWMIFGFYEFSYPFLEVGLMFLALLPFFFLLKCQKYLHFNKEDQKRKFLFKLTDEKSSTFYYFFFMLLQYLDLISFAVIFFSGVNKIDFYHVFLMFFFVAYVIWPKCFKRNFIILLVYVDFFTFEKYLYSLIEVWLPHSGPLYDFGDAMGLTTAYNDKSNNKYFKYAPKFQQWILIVVCFIQYQVYKLLEDEKQVKMFAGNMIKNFKNRYPKVYHFWELIQHLIKEFLILLCFVIFFMMIIFSQKSFINWGFQIIICIFIITYVGVGNNEPPRTGMKRLDKVWNLIIYYAGLVLILQITYQFAALPSVRSSLNLDYVLSFLPSWIRKNLAIIGFTVQTNNIWKMFLLYLLYFAIGVYVRKQLNKWNLEMTNAESDNLQADGKDHSRNSDMEEDYFQDKRNLDWEKEYLKIRFTTPYLVFKLRKIWVVLDKLSQILFVIISVMIMVLSNYWQISLSMLIHLTVFIGLCLVISSKLYQNRKKEKAQYKGKGTLTVEDMGEHWTKYKRNVNEHQVRLRQRAWFFQFVVTLICIAALYPTEFLYYIRQTFESEQQQNIVDILDYLIFYMFWSGIYHSPYEVSGHAYFYNIWGYLIILVLLIFEKNAQQWALNRFGCTIQNIKWFSEIEMNLHRPKEKKLTIAEQEIKEEDEEDDDESSFKGRLSERKRKKLVSEEDPEDKKSHSITSDKGSNSHLFNRSLNGSEVEGSQDLDIIRDDLQKWIRKKYKMKILNGVKILLEDMIQLTLLISSVYKDSIIGLALLFGVFLYMTRRKVQQIVRIAWLVGFCMIIQYGLALSNLTSANNPMDFPFPFNPYPSQDQPEGQFFIPWYMKVPLLNNIQWALYLGMGISNTKLNGLWIDYTIMGLIQAHLFYFGCQLFSVDFKVVKGDWLTDLFNKYTFIVAGDSSPENVKKETRKLKHSIFLYNFYKGSQMTVFMHFHQVTIIVTLLLAILAKSLFSFGYIIVCMIMIYENHKYYRKEQKNFRLQSVLKYWLRPYVFVDIALQLVYQIPWDWLHSGVDKPWSWQNIIGFQDIWTDDKTQKEVVAQSIMYIVLKALTYFFVTLQIQIFSSTAYKKYIKKDMVKFIDMAETKGMSMRMRFNNLKIEQIRNQAQEKRKMDTMLRKLKKLIKKWQSHFYDPEDLVNQVQKQTTTQLEKGNRNLGKSQTTAGNVSKKKPPQLPQKDDKGSFHEDKQSKEDIHMGIPVQNTVGGGNQSQLTLPNQLKNRSNTASLSGGRPTPSGVTPNQSKRADSFNSDGEKNRLPQIMEDEEIYGKGDEELLERMKKKLNLCARLMIWLRKKLTDQIIFLSSESFLKRVVEDMLAGKVNIYTKLERKMLNDIRDIKKQRLTEDMEFEEQEEALIDIEIKDMKRTKEMTTCSTLLKSYLGLTMEIIVTYSDFICYLLMIVSMMKNAGLISLVYPMTVFGYALMEEVNPKKKFWYTVLIYTETLIMVKFLFQLQFWTAFWDPSDIQKFQDILNSWHIGLVRIDSQGTFGQMFAYFIPEILLLFAIMSHIQKEIFIGLLYLKETEMEGIQEALIRVIRYNAIQRSQQNKTQGSGMNTVMSTVSPGGVQEEEEQAQFDAFKINFKKEVKHFYKYNPLNNSFNVPENPYRDMSPIMLTEQEEEGGEGKKDLEKTNKKKKKERHSMVDDQELKKLFDEIQEYDIIRKEIKQGMLPKIQKQIQRIFYQNEYFRSLFPSTKEQKPGKDLYAWMATFQFIICLFLIFFYTTMDADKTNVQDVMKTNQFSGYMVIVLFLQIIIMLVDRYLYKSKTFIQVQDKGNQRRYNQDNFAQEAALISESNEKLERNASDSFSERGKSFIQFLSREHHLKRIVVKGKAKKEEMFFSSSDEEEERRKLERQVVLEQTKITFAIVSKFYLQWILLIIIHGLVFWYFPSMGNKKLSGFYNCPQIYQLNGSSQEKCNEFGQNWTLVVFYMLYCCYFWVSALQIRYGLPEMKKGNFMMSDYGYVNHYSFKVFMAIPFLFELKTFADWTFTRTALDVFQWFELSSTHAELFMSTCLQGRYQRKPLGSQIIFLQKFAVGLCGQFGIILLIAGPLLLFSTFNPIQELNPVAQASINLNIKIQKQGSQAINTINLFSNNYVTELSNITPLQVSEMKFESEAKLKSFDQEQIQYIKMNNYSDSNWGISPPNRNSLQYEFSIAANGSSTTSLKVALLASFDRQNAGTLASQVEYELDLKTNLNAIKAFNYIFSMDCTNKSNSSYLILPDFFDPVLILNDKDTAEKFIGLTVYYKAGVRIYYSCQDYWVLDQYLNDTNPQNSLPNSNLTGLQFFTFSQRVAPSYFKYSIITFYISIVLVIGRLIRGILVIGANRIFIWEIPNGEQLLMLCECVHIYRLRNQLEQEEELYFTFVDIMRSPEMIKAITGSAIKKKQ